MTEGRNRTLGLAVTMFGLLIAIVSVSYVLFLFASTYPSHLWLGRMYWEMVIALIVLLPVFVTCLFIFTAHFVRAVRLVAVPAAT